MNGIGSSVCARLFRGLAVVILLVAFLLNGSPPNTAGKNAAERGSIQVTLLAPPYQISSGEGESPRLTWTAEIPAPVLVRSVALPPDAVLETLQVQMTRVDWTPLPGLELSPAPVLTPFGRPADIQPVRSAQAASPVALLSTGQLRRWRYANLVFAPLTRSVVGEFSLAARVDLQLNFERLAAPRADLDRPDATFDAVAEQRFINYEQASAWYAAPSLAFEDPKGVAIITSLRVVRSSQKLTTYVEHLRDQGYIVYTITERSYGSLTGQPPNGLAEKIRKWLQDNYLTRQLKYVILIGNPAPASTERPEYYEGGDVPMKEVWPRSHQTAYRQTATDAFYADLTGNWDLDGDGYYGEFVGDQGPGGVDFGFELIVGRLPMFASKGSEADLDRVLEKIMRYEAEMDVAWRKTALLPMAFNDPNSDNAVLAEAMKADYLAPAGITADTLYQHKGEGCNSIYASTRNLSETAVLEMWQAKPYGLVTWASHGGPPFAYNGYSPGCYEGHLMEFMYYDTLDDLHPAFVFAASCSSGDPNWGENLGFSALKRGGGGSCLCRGRDRVGIQPGMAAGSLAVGPADH